MKRTTTKLINPESLPLVIEPTAKGLSFSEFLQDLKQNKDFYRAELLKYGGLLFRNFPMGGPDDFVSVIQSLGLGKFCQYIGGDSPRKKIVDGVYTSTEAPPSIKLPLHNELSYFQNYPKHIYFYCEIAPNKKGETILGDARKIYQSIDPEVRDLFMQKGLLYVSHYPHKSHFVNLITHRNHKSWVNVFETEDKKEVEKKCFEHHIALEWNHHDWAQISQIRPSTLIHPQTQEAVWFNQAHHFDFNPKFLGWWRYLGTKLLYFRKYMCLHQVYFADRTRIPRDYLYHVMDVMDENTIYFPWQKGDVLVLDNILAMHGRATFKGKRRILTAMTG